MRFKNCQKKASDKKFLTFSEENRETCSNYSDNLTQKQLNTGMAHPLKKGSHIKTETKKQL